MRGVLALLMLMLAVAAPAARAATTPAQIARALARSPLYVEPSLDDAVPPAQRRGVLRAITRAKRPVFAALVPLTAGDRYGGEEGRFLDVVHSRLGRDGVYVTVGQVLTAREYGTKVLLDRLSRATTVGNFESDDLDEPAIVKVRRFVGALDDPALAARYQRVEAKLEAQRQAPATPSTPNDDGADDDGGGAGLPVLAVVVLAAVVGGGLLLRRRRGARPAPDDEPVIPARVFEHARTAQATDLREEIEARLLAFAEHIDREDVPERPEAQERQQHALDAYAAARRVLQGSGRLPDLAGALVLVEDGSRALAAAGALETGERPPVASPPCFFDPRHPGRTAPVAWQRGLRITACPACTADLRARRPPTALQDEGRPWFEADSLWARTGYGAFEPDLAQRVLRGELG